MKSSLAKRCAIIYILFFAGASQIVCSGFFRLGFVLLFSSFSCHYIYCIIFVCFPLLQVLGVGAIGLEKLCAYYLSCLDLLRSLLSLFVRHSLNDSDNYAELNIVLTDMGKPMIARRLRNTLVGPSIDRVHLALTVCRRCAVEEYPVYAAWGLNLLEVGHFAEARDKFDLCLPYMASDHVESLVARIIPLLERRASLPQDIRSLKKVHVRLSRIQLQDSLNLSRKLWGKSGANKYQKFTTKYTEVGELKPKETTPSNKERRKGFELPAHLRAECLYYLQKYGSPETMAAFQVRHDMLEDACRLIFSKHLPAHIFVSTVAEYCIANGKVPKLQYVVRKFYMSHINVAKPKNVISGKPISRGEASHSRTKSGNAGLNKPETAKSNVQRKDDHKKKETAVEGKGSSAECSSEAVQFHDRNIVHSYLLALCNFLRKRRFYQLLYDLLTFVGDHAAAAMTCEILFAQSEDFDGRMGHLKNCIDRLNDAIASIGDEGSVVLTNIDFKEGPATTVSVIEQGSSGGKEEKERDIKVNANSISNAMPDASVNSNAQMGSINFIPRSKRALRNRLVLVNLQVQITKAFPSVCSIAAPTFPHESINVLVHERLRPDGSRALTSSNLDDLCELTAFILTSNFDLGVAMMKHFHIPAPRLFVRAIVITARGDRVGEQRLSSRLGLDQLLMRIRVSSSQPVWDHQIALGCFEELKSLLAADGDEDHILRGRGIFDVLSKFFVTPQHQLLIATYQGDYMSALRIAIKGISKKAKSSSDPASVLTDIEYIKGEANVSGAVEAAAACDRTIKELKRNLKAANKYS